MNYTADEGAAIVADPDGHFPYKLEDAVAGHTDEVTGRHFSVAEDEASAAAEYIAAQEAALTSPSADATAEVTRTAQALQRIRARRRGGEGATRQLADSQDVQPGPAPETLIVKGA